MKTNYFFRFPMLVTLLVCAGTSVSCMTTYDRNGNPVQSVDPGLAAAGVAAAGLIGYASGRIRSDNHHHYHGGGGYYYAPQPRYYHRGGGYYRP